MHVHDKAGTARKAHRCRVCYERIEAGEPCHIYRGLDRDEGYYTLHFHEDCWANSRDWTLDDWESCPPGSVSRAELNSYKDTRQSNKGAA